ncbi:MULTISPECIES: lipopolysaccharide biosynthesis protein [unclassified Caulobacter]|uniref:lipopolysaccharide biosynthesis protein n=1 Tax=unclassified Caulobacter TaxID=2648921 RepID=UPI0009EB3483|nr:MULTISPECIES: oligosaccharide flippase family protein [unclassified Caulobacter]
MSLGGLKRNATWNLLEVLVSSVVLFVLYRLILKHLGVASLGIWSLVLATTSLARVADLGAAGGLGRYVAVSQARGGRSDDALIYVETALLTNVGFYLVLGLLLYWPAWWGLGLSIHGPAIEQARALLPFAIGSFVLQNISNVVTAALIGFHRSYQKSMLTLLTLMVQAGVALATVQTLGLRGVALAQIVQYVLLACGGWFLVVRAAGVTGFAVPWRIRMAPLRELMGFGLRLQVLNIASFLFDPFTKFAFSSLGGLSALGMYELASRGILQVRQLVVAPGQNLTPLFAAAHERDPGEMRRIYDSALTVIGVASSVAMLGMAVGSPILSLIWMHRIDPLFVLFSFILAGGWFFNTLSTPGFFLGMGTGRLRWNIVGSLISTLGSPSLAWLLAKPLGGVGVAAGAMIAIGSGGVVTWVLNCRSLNVPIWPSREAWACLLARVPGAGGALAKLGGRA